MWILLKLFILNLKVTHSLFNVENPLYFSNFTLIHKFTAPTTIATKIFYIFLYKTCRQPERKLSTSMKLTFQKAALLNGINIVLKAVPSKTTMPILECILIDASTDVIKLTGNDMELGIETKVEGNILEKGKIA